VLTPTGRSRLQMKTTSTFAELKSELQIKFAVDSDAVYTDEKLQSKLEGLDSQTLPSLGLKHGCILYVGNMGDTVASQATEELKLTPKDTTIIDTSFTGVEEVWPGLNNEESKTQITTDA